MKAALFNGTGQIMKLLIRQNRIKLIVWYIGIIGLTLSVASAYPEIYPDEESRAAFAFTMNNPAMVAMLGPEYEEYETLGSLFAHEMLLFTTVAAAIMNILFVGRSTRTDEEDGRVEYICSLPVGRLAYLNSTMLVVLLINVSLAVLIGTGISILEIDGMDVEGAFLYGSVLGGTGLLFATITAILAQFAETARGTNMLSFGVLIAFYLIRASGDVRNEIISFMSPLGWVVRTEVFVENEWWAVYLTITLAIVIGICAFYLNGIRDLGSGFIPARKGRIHASVFLKTPLGLALRLQRTNIMGWAIGLFLLSASFGAILGDLETYYADLDILNIFLMGNSEQMMTEQFIVLLMAIIALIVTVPVVMVVMKVKSEENKNLTENYYSRTVSRTRILGSYVLIGLLVSVLMQTVVALGLWLLSTVVMNEGIAFRTAFGSALVYLPAMWSILGITVCLVGIMPKVVGLVWIYLAYSFIVIYIGAMLDFPEWMNNLSVFHHIPSYPIEQIHYGNISLLMLLAVFFTVIGFISYNKRDIQG